MSLTSVIELIKEKEQHEQFDELSERIWKKLIKDKIMGKSIAIIEFYSTKEIFDLLCTNVLKKFDMDYEVTNQDALEKDVRLEKKYVLKITKWPGLDI